MEPIHSPKYQSEALPDFVQRQFDAASPQNDHRQLYGILQRGIRSGVLAAGTQLPPSRVLAQALKIARNTVVHVYEQLALEGYVQAGVGRGTFVAAVGPRLADRSAAPRQAPQQDRSELLSRRGSQLVREAGAAPLQWGAFTPGVPEVRMFPTAIWSRLQARAARRQTPAQLTYATGPGDAGLRQAVSDYLQGTRGVVCSPEQVVITSGTQQSLHLVAQLLTDPGDKVWLEDPGYWGARSVFRAHGLDLQAVALDSEGMAPSPAQLRQPPRVMFLSPSHQYPLGALMGHGRRQQLLDYAAVHGVWVVEDDYDSEFRYGTRPLPALQGLDTQGRVVYLGTFSKTLYPALRIAYLVLPPDLVDGFAQALNELFREGQTVQQAVLAQFLSEGHYATHIRRMRAIYSARHDALIHAIGQEFGNQLPILGGDAGLHLVLGLPPHLDDAAVAQAALRAGISTRPLSLYHLRQPAATKGLLLGYGAVPEEEIGPSFARLAQVVRGFL